MFDITDDVTTVDNEVGVCCGYEQVLIRVVFGSELCVEFGCGRITSNVELGFKRERFVLVAVVLMAFDVDVPNIELDQGASYRSHDLEDAIFVK